MSSQAAPRESGAYYAMLGLSLLFSILLIITLIPNPGASKPNILGYRSVCSFAPAASALCGMLAGITCMIRARLVSRRAASLRYRPPIVPAFVGIVLVTVAVVSGIRFAAVQSAFTTVIRNTDDRQISPGTPADGLDGLRTGTAAEGEVSATVEVSMASGRMEAIRLVDGKNMDGAVVRTITEKVLAAQSTEVEAVTGATASSLVLLEAIGKAAER